MTFINKEIGMTKSQIQEKLNQKRLILKEAAGRYYVTNDRGKIEIADFINPLVYKGLTLKEIEERINGTSR